jgi:hypothetical protein
LISAHGGGTSQEAMASQLPVQQPFKIVGTSPLGQLGAAVEQLAAAQLGVVPGSHEDRLMSQKKPAEQSLFDEHKLLTVHVPLEQYHPGAHCESLVQALGPRPASGDVDPL